MNTAHFLLFQVQKQLWPDGQHRGRPEAQAIAAEGERIWVELQAYGLSNLPGFVFEDVRQREAFEDYA